MFHIFSLKRTSWDIDGNVEDGKSRPLFEPQLFTELLKANIRTRIKIWVSDQTAISSGAEGGTVVQITAFDLGRIIGRKYPAIAAPRIVFGIFVAEELFEYVRRARGERWGDLIFLILNVFLRPRSIVLWIERAASRGRGSGERGPRKILKSSLAQSLSIAKASSATSRKALAGG
jgi:hypothetical protein